MGDQATGTGATWADVLLKGVSGYIDSQNAAAYAAQQQAYNTAGGIGGQSQYGGLSSNPVLLIGGALLVAVVLFIALKR